jgi:chromosome segregation ATPase
MVMPSSRQRSSFEMAVLNAVLAPSGKGLRWKGVITLLSLGVVFLSGCATRHAPSPAVADFRQEYEQLMRHTRAEEAAMRAELVSLRLAAAKKDAELSELRRQLSEVRKARTDQQQSLDSKQQEVVKLRSERDQLLQTKQDLHVQLAEVPELRQTAATAAATNHELQTRLQSLDATLASVTTELAQLATELATLKSSSKGRAAPRPSRPPATASKSPSGPPAGTGEFPALAENKAQR